MKSKKRSLPKETAWTRSIYARSVKIPKFGRDDLKRHKTLCDVEQGDNVLSQRFCSVCEKSARYIVVWELGERWTRGLGVTDFFVNHRISESGKTTSENGDELSVCDICEEQLERPLPLCHKCDREMLDMPILGQCRQCMDAKSFMRIFERVGMAARARKMYRDASGEDVDVIPYEVWAEHCENPKWIPLRHFLLEAVRKMLNK